MRGKRIYISPPSIGGDELELVGEAISSGWIAPVGPHVDAFEREFAHTGWRGGSRGPRQRHGGVAPGHENPGNRSR